MLNGGTFTPWLKSEQQPFVPDPGGVRSLFTIKFLKTKGPRDTPIFIG
uniref:Uncharacterized protein n=1 Tax=Klebsiella pneumoniae TaxID=573 RepID=A0A6M3HJ23_KLEPN|nr:hypothetical protein [Klebsiella pneumoniae]